MTRKGWKRYPTYRDSGVDWLGEVPEHWQLRPLGFVASTLGGGTPSRSEPTFWRGEIPWVSPKDMKVFRLKDSKEHVSEEALGASAIKLIPPPAVLIVVRGMILAHTFPVAITSVPVTINQDMKALLPSSNLDAAWFGYALAGLQEVMLAEVEAAAHGTCCLRTDRWRRIMLPLPAVQEQLAIASFIERETSKIDALIAEKDELISLLAEKRSACVTHATTRGLDPNVTMKDSGEEWLGEIPEHWGTARLKHATSRIVDCPHSTPKYSDSGQYLVVRTADITPGRLHLNALYRVEEDQYLERIRREPVLAGDIVYSREGERYGIAAEVPQGHSFCLGQRMMQFRANKANHGGYLMWTLNSHSTLAQAQQDSLGSTAPHVNVSTIRNFVFPRPPLDEAKQISRFINRATSALDSQIRHLRESKSYILEHRQALITAAVTGQIDVREELPA